MDIRDYIKAFLCLGLLSGPLAAKEDPATFRYRQIGPAEGLAQSSVYSLLQDRHGFMWLGTQDGLHRYDGYNFAITKPKPYQEKALPHGMVPSLLEDRAGSLWVGTFQGLAGSTDGGLTFELPLGNQTPPINALIEDRQARLWVATQNQGVYRISADRLQLENFRRGTTGALPSDHVAALLEDRAGAIWLGADQALLRLRGDGASFETVWQSGGPPIRTLLEDHRGRLWVGLDGGGLARFEPGRLEPRRFLHREDDPQSLGADDISVLFEDRQRRLWVGTLSRGLDLFDEATESFVHIRHALWQADGSRLTGLSHNTVRAILEDRGGLIWVGTAQGGVTVINTHPRLGVARGDGERAAAEATGALPAESVRAFLEVGGELLVGTDGGGLVWRDARTGRHRPFASDPALPEKRIWSLFRDRQGAVWIGGQNGLYRYDGATTDPTPSKSAGQLISVTIPGQERGAYSVRSMVQDEAGRIWVGHFGGGLSRLEDSRGEKVENFRHLQDVPFSLPSNHILVLYRDRRDHLWVGTTEGLVRRTADGRFHAYRHDPQDRTSLIGNVVRAIYQDPSGNLWVGTDGGLNKLAADIAQTAPGSTATNNRGFNHYTEAEGLPNNTVYAIVPDDRGRLWLSTNRGLARFDPRTESFSSFGLEDGVQSLEFNGGAAARLADGQLVFGGVQGYNFFHPEAVAENRHVPTVQFSEVKVLDRQLELPRAIWQMDTIELEHDDHVVFVNFAALDFTDPTANRYAYRLLGFDERWHELGTKHDLSFTNLGPGQYQLEVRGANDDGLWNEQPATLRVVVRSPPWRSWWAILAYAVVLGFVLFWFWRESQRRQALRRQIDTVTRTSEERLNLALLGSGDGLWDWNISTGEIFRSRIAEPLGWDPSELPGGHDFRKQLVHPDDQEAVERTMQAHLRGEIPRFEVEYRMRDKAGAWRWILDRGTVVERDAQGRPLRMAGTFKDMTAHKETESKLRLWSTVFKSINEGVVIIDPEGVIQAVNPAMAAMTGWTASEMVGQSMAMLESRDYPPETYQALRHALEVEGRWQGELRQPRKDGSHLTAWIDFNAVRDDQGRLSHFVAVLSDITRRKESEEELRYLANYDTLTGLPNRTLFQQKLEAALQEARQSGKKVALLFGDLDQFKQVNDTMGHAVGDLLLQETSRRLLASVRRVDTVARLGGDEFTVLLQEVANQEAVIRVADRILRSFQKSFVLDNHELDVSTSLGISVFPDDGSDGQTLLKHADTAMYEAKEKGRNCYRFYTQAMSERAIERLTLESRLRRALQNDELRLVYQPKFDIAASKVVGVEALLRWQLNDNELLGPGAFIEMAEQTGLIVPIGQWVLETACRQAMEWRAAGLPAVDVAVNVSPHQLNAAGFVDLVRAVLLETGISGHQIVLELTESALMEHAEQNILLLEQLKALGVQLSIDDFGTGYSSLSYLKRLPIDEVKIDRSFLVDLAVDDAIVRAIIAMAGSLGLRVVAEGVERAEQLEALRRDGCIYVQGFLLGRPRPGQDIPAVLSELPALPTKKTKRPKPN